MKKSIKPLLTAILTGVLAALLFGCGKNETGAQDEAKGFVYVPEYKEVDIECDYISDSAVSGDDIYMAAMTFDEESGQTESFIYRYNLLDNKSEKVPLDAEGDYNIYDMLLSADGNLVMAVNLYKYETDENGEITDGVSTMELWSVSPEDGSVISATDITDVLGSSEYAYVQYLCEDGQGNLYFCDGESSIHVVNKDFQKLCDITTDGWINGMTTSREGDVYISTYGETGVVLKKVDAAAKKLGEIVEGVGGGYGNLNYFTSASKSLLMSSAEKLALVDLSSGTAEELFKWLDVDIDGNSIDTVGELSDGRCWALTREYGSDGNSYELIYLTRKDASEVAQKEIITYGALWLDSDLRKSIIDFNKTNEKYRISVKEYGGDNYSEGLTQFNTDLTSGSCPDIIDLSVLDFDQYASKGILEDLYPYMEKSGIKKEDYLENILGAYEKDGKLYGVMPKFYIVTTMAKTSLVGEANGWTLSEMLDFVEKNEPENVFQYGSRSSIFYYCIYNNIDEFIDWESGKCFFEGEEFGRVLEFASKYPEEVDYNQDEEGISSKLRSNKVLLMDTSLSSVQEYQMMNGLFGEKVTYIGFPNSEKKGNLIQPTGGSMGISSKSKNKDGAWEFVQTIFSSEFQDGLVSEHGGWGFPIKKSALDKQFEVDMTPEYYEDENGEKVEQSKTTWGYDDFQMEIMAATQEEVDAVRYLITSAEKLSGNINEQLVNIITEESEPFFKGQKSAADVAGVIQNRIQIYVNENR